MDETVTDLIGGKTREEWARLVYCEANPLEWSATDVGVIKHHLAEFEDAACARRAITISALLESVYRADVCSDKLAREATEAETRPCPTCGGAGQVADRGMLAKIGSGSTEACFGPCPDCTNGSIPLALAVALEVVARIRVYAADLHAGPSPGWVADQITPWARAKYGKEADDAD